MLTGTGKDDPVTWNFECTGPSGGQNLGVQTTIGVPSNWELQGFGTYNYGTSSPQNSDVGQYSYNFTVPASWAGQNVQLVFEGAMTDTTVTINGVSAGPTHQGGFTQFRYTVSSLLNYGSSNTIAVTVAEASANASVNNAERSGDYWNFGGIYRPVYLECRPAQSIQTVAINALATGALTAQVSLNSVSAGETLTGTIQTLAGLPVGSSFSTTLTAAQATATLSTTASGITPWNPENPSLYQLVLQLWNGSTLIHSYTQQFGFRTVSVVAGQGIFINGVKVRLKGICKHTFWPSSGRTSSPALSAQAVAMLQGANINAVRMSHYPPDQHFLDQCDAAGLMVLDELPGWQKAYDNATAARMVSEMVPRDVNHPCIIFWDNGNEGGWNTTVDGSFALYDPQGRTVRHPGSGSTFNNIYDKHYPTYTETQTSLAGTSIVEPTEFLHCLYDGGGGSGLFDWWALMEQSPLSAGGFLWSWDDEGVVRTDEGGIIDTAGNEAPDGIVGPYWQPEPSYYAIRDIWSPVTIPTAPVLSGSFNGQITVHNDYFFTSVSACTFSWQVVDFPLISSGKTGVIVSSSGNVTGPAVAPQQNGTLQLNLPSGWQNHAALQLTAYNSSGQLLTTWTWPIQSQATMESANLPAATGVATAVTSGSSVVLSGSNTNTQVTISKTTGLITSVVANGVTVSLTGPSLVSGTGTFSSLTVQQSGNNQVVTANFTGNLETITYTMRGDGWMKIDSTFNLTGTQSYIGLTFDYPETNVQNLLWLGDGPEPVWQNRLAGVSTSVWSKSANDEVPGYIWFTAPVFRGFHSKLQWATIQTSEQPINIIAETPGLYLRVNTPGNGVTPKNATAALPPGNLSLLEAISAMGDKFNGANAGNDGPMSGPATAAGAYESVFWMNFGNDVVSVDNPEITSVVANNPISVTVTFNEPMSASALEAGNYSFSPSVTINSVTQGAGNSYILNISPLTSSANYTLSVASLTSANGSSLQGTNSFTLSFNNELILDLPFDTDSGGIAPDISGNGYNASLLQTTLSTGIFSNATTFTGNTGSMATVTIPSLSQYTIAGWIKMAGNGNSQFPRIVSLANDSVQFFIDLSSSNTQNLGFQASGVDSWRSTAKILPALGTWMHVAVTYDGTTPTFYLNGSALTTLSPSSASGTYATGGLAAIGNRSSDGLRGFDGSIENFEIYNRILSPTEIADLAIAPDSDSPTMPPWALLLLSMALFFVAGRFLKKRPV